MGVKLWGTLEEEDQIKMLKEKIKIIELEYERLLEENDNLKIIIKEYKEEAFNK